MTTNNILLTVWYTVQMKLEVICSLEEEGNEKNSLDVVKTASLSKTQVLAKRITV
jgi:hypothetical protein